MPLDGSKDRFRINVFNVILDIVISQLKNRFKAMTYVTEKFSTLRSNVLCSIDDDELLRAATILKDKYPDDLTGEFPMQLVSFRATMKQQIGKRKLSMVKELALLLLVEYAVISPGFADVVTAVLLFLTLLVTVASAERTFSKLKIIKNYLRNTMEQDRLRGSS